MSVSFWTAYRDAEAARLMNDGLTIADAAFAIGTSPDALRRRLAVIRRDRMTETKTRSWAWTPERLRDLRRMRSEGMRAAQIARVFGISEQAVAAQSTRMQLCTSHVQPAEIDAIIEMAGEGATLSRIARRHRIDEVAVTAILSRNGVSAGSLPQSYNGADRRRASR